MDIKWIFALPEENKHLQEVNRKLVKKISFRHYVLSASSLLLALPLMLLRFHNILLNTLVVVYFFATMFFVFPRVIYNASYIYIARDIREIVKLNLEKDDINTREKLIRHLDFIKIETSYCSNNIKREIFGIADDLFSNRLRDVALFADFKDINQLKPPLENLATALENYNYESIRKNALDLWLSTGECLKSHSVMRTEIEGISAFKMNMYTLILTLLGVVFMIYEIFVNKA